MTEKKQSIEILWPQFPRFFFGLVSLEGHPGLGPRFVRMSAAPAGPGAAVVAGRFAKNQVL